MWIKRDISTSLEQNSDLIQVLRGPRQCGKSSLLLHLDSGFKELSLDDAGLRELAQSDPELFMKQFADQKLLIDEAQYAPALFPALKRRVDLLKRDKSREKKPIIRLTGSNQILMDRNVKESLAGRASFFDLNTLSVSEILEARPNCSIQEILFKGGWPELHADPSLDPKRFLDNYITSYIEKDIVLSAGIQKSREFLRFIQLLAGRVGELLDLTGLGRECGIDAKTVKDWTSVLEKMGIIALIQPYYSNLSSRLVKTPKVYFIDTGLACRLQGWTTPEPIITSPQQGHLFENLVFSEFFKIELNYQLGWKIHHWRSRDGEEVDFLLQKSPREFLFIEAKVSPVKTRHAEELPEVRKVFRKNLPSLIVCHQEGERILDGQVPLAKLKKFLLER